jgi:hypothetical protein
MKSHVNYFVCNNVYLHCVIERFPSTQAIMNFVVNLILLFSHAVIPNQSLLKTGYDSVGHLDV